MATRFFIRKLPLGIALFQILVICTYIFFNKRSPGQNLPFNIENKKTQDKLSYDTPRKVAIVEQHHEGRLLPVI